MINDEKKTNKNTKQQHLELQSEKTKKMMKNAKKRSKKLNRKKKEPFFKKLLGL